MSLRWDADVDPTQRELAWTMSDLSEEHYCAGWMSDCEFELWAMVVGGDRQWGMGEVAPDDVEQLRALSEKCGGWVTWRSGVSGESFVPMPEWLEMYAEWKEQT